MNLIPLNEHPGAPGLRTPGEEAIGRFADRLARAHVAVTVRRGRGGDVFAACGQLGATSSSPVPGGGQAEARLVR